MAAWTVPSHWRTRPADEKGDVMRTMRVSLVGTVTLALLGGLGGTVLAQGEEPAENLDWVLGATFSGTSECMVTGFGEVNDANQRRGYVSECTVSTSDPRASGTNTIDWDSDCNPGIGCVAWGTFELVGPDGTWEGSFTGSTVGSGEDIRDMDVAVGRGTGAYEGWTLIAHAATPEANPFAGTYDGLIYLGDPPPHWGTE
jgi:hypothetical protein